MYDRAVFDDAGRMDRAGRACDQGDEVGVMNMQIDRRAAAAPGSAISLDQSGFEITRYRCAARSAPYRLDCTASSANANSGKNGNT